MFRYVLTAVIFWFVWQGVRTYLAAPNKPRPQPPRSVPSNTPYDILGVSPSASSDDIRAAYQNLVRQYHPDRVATMAEEFREVAERRTKEINAAYTELKRLRRVA